MGQNKPEYELINRDVPIKGVLKYIVAERDKHKARAESVAQYAKALEAKVAELEQELVVAKNVIAEQTEKLKISDPIQQQRAMEKALATLRAEEAKKNKKRRKHIKAALGKIEQEKNYLTELYNLFE